MTVGFLVMDKPPGITSHDVVSVLRAVFGIKKIGHTGTLDPFATGVLPMAIGHATKLISFLDEGVKTYEATLALGVKTDTGDCDGDPLERREVPSLSLEAVQGAVNGLVGPQLQKPPLYSAVKVRGKPLYKYARSGEEVEVKARPIEVFRSELVDQQGPTIRFRVQCSKGTYIRTLGEDLASALGTVGHLVALRRTESGPFQLSASLSFPALSQVVAGRTDWPEVLRPRRGAPRIPWHARDDYLGSLERFLIDPDVALEHLPALSIGAEDRRTLRLRGFVTASPEAVGEGDLWRVQLDGVTLGVVRKTGAVSRVARMLPDR